MTEVECVLDGHALHRLDREVPTRFALDATIDGVRRRLTCEGRRRLLPGRRLVTTSELDGRPVLLKLFFGPGAASSAQREIDGAARLAAARVRTPARLADGSIDGGRVVAFELIASATPLRSTALPAAAAVLARLHGVALVHDDPTADNFLLTPGTGDVHCVDGAAISARGSPPSRRVRIEQLARLAAQFGLAGRQHLAAMREAYASASDGALGDLDDAALDAAFDLALAARADAYVRKCVRDCSEFRVARSLRRTVVCRRDAWDALAELLADPDAALRHGTALKRGNSAIVTRVQVRGREVVVKRYNAGSYLRRLRASIRGSRALRAWRNGHRLRLLGISTPAPIAVVVERFGPLQGRAWLVTEVAEGTRLDRTDPLAHVEGLVALFRALARAGLVHGDTKAGNFLVNAAGPVLLDLDAMRAPRSRFTRRRGHARDLARFLANWPGLAPLAEAFERAGLR